MSENCIAGIVILILLFGTFLTISRPASGGVKKARVAKPGEGASTVMPNELAPSGWKRGDLEWDPITEKFVKVKDG